MLRGFITRSRVLMQEAAPAGAPAAAKPWELSTTTKPHKIFHYLSHNGPTPRKKLLSEFKEDFQTMKDLKETLQRLKQRKYIMTKEGIRTGKARPAFEYQLLAKRKRKPIMEPDVWAKEGKPKADAKLAAWQSRTVARQNQRKQVWADYLSGKTKSYPHLQ